LQVHPPGLIGRFSVQSKVPRSRSRTASFQPTCLGAVLEVDAFRRVAGDAVEDGGEHLRLLQPHRLDRLIDHQLLHHQLVDRNGRHALGERSTSRVEFGRRHRLQHEPDPLGFRPSILSPVNSMRLARSGPSR
jgi:hypothetical protein